VTTTRKIPMENWWKKGRRIK